MTEIDLSKYTEWPQEFVTRDGKTAIICGLVEGTDQWFGRVRGVAHLWRRHGEAVTYGSANSLDRPFPKKIIKWVNFYPWSSGLRGVHNTKEDADRSAGYDRIACVRVEFTEGDGL